MRSAAWSKRPTHQQQQTNYQIVDMAAATFTFVRKVIDVANILWTVGSTFISKKVKSTHTHTRTQKA